MRQYRKEGGAISAFDDAAVLVEQAESDLRSIRRAYESSLKAQEISSDLLVRIKNFCENLRSALDYTARGLFEKYGDSSTVNPRVYFPYARADQDGAAFGSSRRVETCIPGLTANRPDIVARLTDIQHYEPNGHSWLPAFMRLVNENKHQGLTPQVRRETKELRISSGGAAISVGEGASISLGPGAEISIGSARIRGGQSFGVGRPPRVEGGKVEQITWISFHFALDDLAVLPFLESALEGTRSILGEFKVL